MEMYVMYVNIYCNFLVKITKLTTCNTSTAHQEATTPTLRINAVQQNLSFSLKCLNYYNDIVYYHKGTLTIFHNGRKLNNKNNNAQTTFTVYLLIRSYNPQLFSNFLSLTLIA